MMRYSIRIIDNKSHAVVSRQQVAEIMEYVSRAQKISRRAMMINVITLVVCAAAISFIIRKF